MLASEETKTADGQRPVFGFLLLGGGFAGATVRDVRLAMNCRGRGVRFMSGGRLSALSRRLWMSGFHNGCCFIRCDIDFEAGRAGCWTWLVGCSIG